MTKKQEETKKVKEALKSMPYRVKIRHGKGTSSGWIKAYIPKRVWEAERKVIEAIIANITGRQGLEENRISVQWYE